MALTRLANVVSVNQSGNFPRTNRAIYSLRPWRAFSGKVAEFGGNRSQQKFGGKVFLPARVRRQEGARTPTSALHVGAR